MQAVAGFDLQFSPAFNETTHHYLFSLTTILQLVSKPKNCELKQDGGFAVKFCFNSKPSFSFDSIGQKINILLPRHLVVTTEESV